MKTKINTNRTDTMKKQQGSTLAALLFFVLIIGLSFTSQAQSDSIPDSPLFSTSGANVLDEGDIMWCNNINIFHGRHKWGETYNTKYTIFDANSGLRWGIGSRAELTLAFDASHSTGMVSEETIPDGNYCLTPSVGARLHLFGDGFKIPVLTFYTDVTLPIRHGQLIDTYNETLAEPVIGIQLSRRFRRSLRLDLSLGYAWNQHNPYIYGEPFRYSFNLRWLKNENHMISFGTQNHQAVIEHASQITDNLQLSESFMIAGGINDDVRVMEGYFAIGLNWKLR